MPGAILVFIMIGGLAALLLSKKEEQPALPPAPNPRLPDPNIPTDPGEIGPVAPGPLGPFGPISPGQPQQGVPRSRNYPQTLPDPGPAIGASKNEIASLLPEPFKSNFIWLSENVEAPGALKAAATGFSAAGYSDAAEWLKARADQIIAASAQHGEPVPVLPPISTTTPPVGWPQQTPFPPPAPGWWPKTQQFPPIQGTKPAGWPDWLAWPPAPPQGWPLEVPFPIPPQFDPGLLNTILEGRKINLPPGLPQINVGRGPSRGGYPTPVYGPIKSDGTDAPFMIAERITGNANRWPELVDANPEFERHPTLGMIYKPGDMLNLPRSWVALPKKGRYPAPPMRPSEIATWSKTLAVLAKGA